MSKSGLKHLASKKVPLNKLLYFWLLGASLVVGGFLYFFHPILLPFLVAGTFGYALHPLVSFLEQKGVARTVTALFLVFLILFFLITFLFVTIPFIIQELHILALKFPDHLHQLKNKIVYILEPRLKPFIQGIDLHGDLQKVFTKNLNQIISWIFKALASLFTSSFVFINLLYLLFLTPLLVFYLLRDWPKILNFLRHLVPPSFQKPAIHFTQESNRILGRYFRGQALVCFVLSVYYIAFLTLFKVDFSVTVGLLSGVLSFIPYVGFFIGFTIALGIAFSQFDILNALILILSIYVVGHLLESFYLIPRLIGAQLSLHPVWVIFSLLAGGYLFGFTGLLLAIPTASLLSLVIRLVLEHYQKSLSLLKN